MSVCLYLCVCVCGHFKKLSSSPVFGMSCNAVITSACSVLTCTSIASRPIGFSEFIKPTSLSFNQSFSQQVRQSSHQPVKQTPNQLIHALVHSLHPPICSCIHSCISQSSQDPVNGECRWSHAYVCQWLMEPTMPAPQSASSSSWQTCTTAVLSQQQSTLASAVALWGLLAWPLEAYCAASSWHLFQVR